MRATPGSGQSPSELWTTDLTSGVTQRVLMGQTVTAFDLSADDRVVAAVPAANDKSQLWLGWIDGREPARRIADIEGDNPRFAAGGEILFRAPEGNGFALSRVREDGTGRQRVASVRTFVFGGVSPDGHWIGVSDRDSLTFYSSQGDRPVRLLAAGFVARARWSADGTRINLLPSGRRRLCFRIRPDLPHSADRWRDAAAGARRRISEGRGAGGHSRRTGSAVRGRRSWSDARYLRVLADNDDSQFVPDSSSLNRRQPPAAARQHSASRRSSRCSQALARRHSRLMVRVERCSTCAVSSTLNPPKKRSSTTCP